MFVEVGDAYLRERRGDVADVVGRLRRNLRPRPRERRSVVARPRRPRRARRRRTAAVAGGADRLGDWCWAWRSTPGAAPTTPRFSPDRCGLPAVAGLQRRDRACQTRRDHARRRDVGRGRHRPDPGRARGGAGAARLAGRERWRGRRPRLGPGARPPTASPSGSRPTSSCPTSWTSARAARRRGHRAVSIGVPPGRPRRWRPSTKRRSSRSTAIWWSGWRPYPVTVRTFDVDESQHRRAAGGREMAAASSAAALARAARAARDSAQPDTAATCSACSCARLRAPRAMAPCACCFRSCRPWRSCARPGRPSTAARAKSAPRSRCRAMPVGVDDRGAVGGAHGRPARAQRRISSASAPTISSSTAWRWIAPMSGSPGSTSPCIRPSCGSSRLVRQARPAPRAPRGGLRRDGGGPGAAAAAARPRRHRVQHERRGHSRGAPAGAAGPADGSRRAAAPGP